MVADAEIVDDKGDEIITRRARDGRLEPMRLAQFIRRTDQLQASLDGRNMLFMYDFIEQVDLSLRSLLCTVMKTKQFFHVFEHHEVRHALIAHEDFQRDPFDAHFLEYALFRPKMDRFGIGNDTVHIVDKCFQEDPSIRACTACM